MNSRSMIPWYLGAILGTMAIAVAALVALEIAHADIDRGFVGILGAIIVPTLTALIAALRSEANGQQIAVVDKKVDTAADAADAAKRVAIAARKDIAEATALAADGKKPP
jgi:hypothetical protein